MSPKTGKVLAWSWLTICQLAGVYGLLHFVYVDPVVFRDGGGASMSVGIGLFCILAAQAVCVVPVVIILVMHKFYMKCATDKNKVSLSGQNSSYAIKDD